MEPAKKNAYEKNIKFYNNLTNAEFLRLTEPSASAELTHKHFHFEQNKQ